MQWVVVIRIYFVEKAEGGYISTMIQIIITIFRKQNASTSNNLTQHIRLLSVADIQTGERYSRRGKTNERKQHKFTFSSWHIKAALRVRFCLLCSFAG